MPNWCMNNLTISHNNPAKLQEFVDAYNAGNTCEHFIPHPPHIVDDIRNNNAFGDKVGGGDGWYNWRVNNWGTKWDFGLEKNCEPASIEDNKVVISFNTAWSPPREFYEYLTDEHGYSINASYWEPGMSFCGYWTDGTDDYYEYVDHREIPHGLWDEYGMAEFFEEMVEE